MSLLSDLTGDSAYSGEGPQDGWDAGTAFASPITDSTVTSDVATASADTSNTGLNSVWSGFGTMLDKVVSYGLQKDAAKTSLQLQQQRQATLGVPLLSTTAGGVSVNSTGLLLIGALVVGVVVLASHKG